MTDRKNLTSRNSRPLTRRRLLGLSAAAGAGLTVPPLWMTRRASAQAAISGSVKHLIYIRLSGGFRFPPAFNADVAAQFNPFGQARNVPEGVQWGVGRLLEAAEYLQNEQQQDGAENAIQMLPANELADRITVMPTVDHEPLAGRADGNHETGLERYFTGYVGGDASFFTRIMMGLRERYDAALLDGQLLLPAFVLGSAGMARGLGKFAPYRPPVLGGAGFDQFTVEGEGPPDWATSMADQTDTRMQARQHPGHRETVEAYIRTREATRAYADIFASEALKVDEQSDESIDGISNNQLRELFGDSRESRDLRLGLRLFHYGCPAIYLDQGGYDYHSGEEDRLPGAMENVNRMISALAAALPLMEHPDGGTYWDHTLVVLGSEFSRTAGNSRFNSARGSDHNGDNATRWMSMPFMGGAVSGGRIVGASTTKDDLTADGTVYSYRSVCNTLMTALGCSSDALFPGDDVVPDLVGT